MEDWKRVVWSDETKINHLGSDGRSWVWKKAGEGPCQRTVSGTVKFGGLSNGMGMYDVEWSWICMQD